MIFEIRDWDFVRGGMGEEERHCRRRGWNFARALRSEGDLHCPVMKALIASLASNHFFESRCRQTEDKSHGYLTEVPDFSGKSYRECGPISLVGVLSEVPLL